MRTPFSFPSLRSALLGVFLGCLSGVGFADSSSASAQLLSGERLRGTFDGIECEYSPGHEELARALAARFAKHNELVASKRAGQSSAEAAVEPLSVGEMHANRGAYLGRIAALLALQKPTALQEETYDAFLANYEETMILFDAIRTGYESLQVVKRVTVWDRDELVNRLQRGEKIVGMSYDPATKQGNTSYGGEIAGINDRLVKLAEVRQNMKVSTHLNLETKDGVTNYRAQFDVGKRTKDNAPTPSASLKGELPAAGVSEWLPVIIPAGLSAESPEELAQLLWEGLEEGSVVKMFDAMAAIADGVARLDPQISFLVLHETIEIGIIDRYFRGPDRRWFCDGVANYGAWSVLRDLHGEEVATKIHNLPAQLQSFADLRSEADLRKWPASEHAAAEQTHSRLEVARYAFAENAVVLMNEHGGKDALPRLFIEIGKTKPNKVSMKTVEKSWQKISSTQLDTILAEAVQPPEK